MQAYISGQAGLAICVEGIKASIINADSLDTETACSPNAISYILQGVTDIQVFSSLRKTEVKGKLLSAWKADRALFFFLTLLSRNEHPDNYELARESLSELIVEEKIQAFILNRMYTAPLTEDSNILNALSITSDDHIIHGILEELSKNQKIIIDVWKFWEALPVSLFESNPNKKHKFKNDLEQNGIQRSLVLAHGDSNKFNTISFEYFKKFSKHPNYRDIFTRWIKELKPENSDSKVNVYQKEDDKTIAKGKSKRKPDKSVHNKIESITKQIDEIRKLLENAEVPLAKKFVGQLITKQTAAGDNKYAAKSLCNISNAASDITDHSLQLEWTHQAVELAPDDGWAHGQLAQAYLKLAQYDNAEKHFIEAAKYGERAYGISGQARLLRKCGKLDEALDLYNKIVIEIPDDIYITVGKAQTLANMHKFDEALEVFNHAISLHPEEVKGYVSKANTLRYMGRLDDALVQYNYAIKNFQSPADVDAYCGKAATLRELSRLEESQEAYKQAIARFPHEAKPLCGLAEVLREGGKPDEALQIYKDAKIRFSYDVKAHLGYAKTLHEIDKPTDAEKEYKDIATKFSSSYFVRDEYAKFLASQQRFNDALNEYDKNIKDFPYDTSARIGRAKILKVLGYIDDAIASYDYILKIRPSDKKSELAKASLLIAAGRFKEAEDLLKDVQLSENPQTRTEWIGYQIAGMILLKTNRLDESIKHFQEGLVRVPYNDIKCSFSAAIATAQIRLERYAPAIEELARCDKQSPFTNILQMHAFAKLGGENSLKNAKQAYKNLQNIKLPSDSPVVQLADEIAAIFHLSSYPRHYNDNWIIEKEEEQAWLMAA
jgi:tetratricopeptide (TPR) repeat protein